MSSAACTALRLSAFPMSCGRCSSCCSRALTSASHEQIARDTGAVRETVTRMLRHFADDGIVSLGRGTVTVADAEKLRRLAGM